jgi:prepilin signal peptidase PulO-like enzyme (type II secretory pathway)
MISLLLAALSFAALAALGLVTSRYICAGIEPLPDGPVPGVVPERIILAAAGVLGAVAAARGLPLPALAIAALACGLLAAVWSSDVTRGIIPDVFTLVPLGALLLAAVLAGHWEVAIASIVPTVPFAFLAWRSRGMGLGWGDVKLAALGGPLIGMQHALIAFALGCLAAVVVARLRGMRGQPVAFAPYLATAIAVPLALLTPGVRG